MKNTAGTTSVEYEIRMTESGTVLHKSITPSESFNPDLVSVGNYNTYSSDYDVGPGHVTVTLIVTLTLLLTMLAAVAILYKTIQKRMTPYPEPDVSPVHTQVQTPLSRNKIIMPFVHNNMGQEELQAGYVAIPSSELALMRSTAATLDPRRLFHANNKLKSSSSDSAFNVMTTLNGTERLPALEPGYQYLTVARRHPPPVTEPPRPSQTMEEYARVTKPRYCTPNLTGCTMNFHEHTYDDGVSMGCVSAAEWVQMQNQNEIQEEIPQQQEQ